ncbi:MAG: methyltransferase domain-containing protein [Planctomycetes bacterium]|nr:methyltransferase domain-containing protein [Planctomycetota bacterium]
MKYFFLLGSNPALSIAEISNIVEGRLDLIGSDILTWQTEEEQDIKSLMNILGGTIKIGIILDESNGSLPDLIFKTKELAIKIADKHPDKKFNFGFSFHGKIKTSAKILGMTVKTELKKKNVKCRWVISKEKILSSVIVVQNKLLDLEESCGLEVSFIKDGNKILLGKTLATQDFKDFSARDYGRPSRDDLSGMLPPKLARIMLNIAGKNKGKIFKILLDPFCGSGTVLSEALTLGYKNLIGSDISEKALKDSKENISWIEEKYKLTNITIRYLLEDACVLATKIEKNSIDLVVTEPYLGPQRGEYGTEKIIQELENLYSKAISQIYQLIKKGGRVVIIWPVFIFEREGKKQMKFLNPSTSGLKIIDTINEKFNFLKHLPLSFRKTIIYGREGQRVWREIILLEKI